MAVELRQMLRAGGSRQEIAFSISPEAPRGLAGLGAAAGIAASAHGPLVGRELLLSVEAKGVDGTPRTISLHGLDAVGATLRGSASISNGRPFKPGSCEIVVSARLARDHGVEAPGGAVRLGPLDWTVSGIVSAGGGAAESEVRGDLDTVRSAFDRHGEIQALRLRLDGPAGLAKLWEALPRSPRRRSRP